MTLKEQARSIQASGKCRCFPSTTFWTAPTHFWAWLGLCLWPFLPPSPAQRSWGFLAEAGSDWLSCTSIWIQAFTVAPYSVFYLLTVNFCCWELRLKEVSWQVTVTRVYVLSHFHRVQLCAALWTVSLQAPLCMGLFRQEYWSGLPCPPPGIFPTQGLNPCLLHLPALAGGFFTTRATTHLVDRYLLSTYYILGTSADAEVSAGNEQRQVLTVRKLTLLVFPLWWQAKNKRTKDWVSCDGVESNQGQGGGRWEGGTQERGSLTKVWCLSSDLMDHVLHPPLSSASSSAWWWQSPPLRRTVRNRHQARLSLLALMGSVWP